MTLSDFALLVDAPAKWVLNARAVIGAGVRYSVAVAERMALVRALNRDLAIPLPAAWKLAGEVLEKPSVAGRFSVEPGDGMIDLTIDVYRLRAAVATRRSVLASQHEPRRTGRKPVRPSNKLVAAQQYGLDLSLLRSNIARRPDERLRQLDAMAAFKSRVRRKP